MRPIKFRAWDTLKEEMCEPGNPYITQFQACEIADQLTCGRFLSFQEKHTYIFLQFTGLTGKNGKEIYEGDIIIGLRNEERSPQYEVYFDSEILAFFIRKGDKNYHLCDLKEVEVIGNIYENPELIQSK